MSRGFWTRNFWVMVLAAVVFVGGILAWTNQAGHGRALAAQDADIARLERELRQKRQAEAKVADENASKALGIAATRLDDDEAIIATLLSTAFTWDSGAAYESARESLKKKYGLTEDDEFLQDFIPPALYSEDAEGKKHYLFDRQGTRATFGGVHEIVVVKVAGTKYRYAVLADIAIRAKEKARNGRGEKSPTPPVTRRVLLWITVDGEGAVSNLSAVLATGTMRTSR